MKRNLLILFCTFGLLFFVTRTTMAQDIESTAAPIATVEPLPVEIIDGEGETAGMSPLLQIALSISAVIVALSFAFEKVGNRAKAANNSPFETAALEKLGDGVPSAVVIGMTGVFERTIMSMENMLQTWKEATDHVPAITKQLSDNTSVSSTGAPDVSTLSTPSQDGM